MQPFTHLSIHPSIHPPVHSSTHPSIHPPIYLPIYHPFMQPFTHLSIHPSRPCLEWTLNMRFKFDIYVGILSLLSMENINCVFLSLYVMNNKVQIICFSSFFTGRSFGTFRPYLCTSSNARTSAFRHTKCAVDTQRGFWVTSSPRVSVWPAVFSFKGTCVCCIFVQFNLVWFGLGVDHLIFEEGVED